MKRLALTLVAALALSACREEVATVIPVGLCAPSTDAKTCSSNGRCSTFLAGQTFIYLGLNGGTHPGMQYFMQFDNQLPLNGDESSFRTNSNDAYLEEVVMEYVVRPSSFSATPPFPVPDASDPCIPTLVRAQSSGTPAVTIIPPDVVTYLTAHVAAGDMIMLDVTVRGRGHYLGGSSFETAPYTVPVWVIGANFDEATEYVCATAGDTVTHTCPVGGVGGATFACAAGGGGAGGFTIGGNVNGLTAAGLVLDAGAASGLADLTVPANANTFEFAGSAPTGTAYDVTVQTQPAGLTCTVTNGSGTVGSSSITNITITCI